MNVKHVYSAGELSPSMLSAAFVALLILLWLATVLYHLFLSPVAKIPGPRLAAITFWYEFYYDVWNKGQYTWKLKELHKQYGIFSALNSSHRPIIRINPYEIHVDDPEVYDQIYVGPAIRPTDKWQWSVNMFQAPTSTVSTIPHALHRRRRAMFANHFSTTSIYNLEPILQNKVEKFMDRMYEAKLNKKAFPLTYAYSALTIDIITLYSFGKPYGCLDSPSFAKHFHDVFRQTSLATHTTKHFPRLISLLYFLPKFLTDCVLPSQKLLQEMQENFASQARKVKEEHATKIKPLSDGDDGPQKLIFESMIHANVPAAEKSLRRLTEDAQLLVLAGTITTAHTLMTISWYLLSNPPVLARLKDELANVQDSSSTDPQQAPIRLRTLESLPYLTATIREGLRLGTGVPHRLQRVSPTTALHIAGYDLPPGTPVSMSAMLMHYNPDVFPEPEVFNPDRWLPLDTEGKRLNKYLVPFSRGSRQCVGINLAWAEMQLTIAAIFGKNGPKLSLHDTVFERDVKTVIDGFNPLTMPGSEGVKVMVE